MNRVRKHLSKALKNWLWKSMLLKYKSTNHFYFTPNVKPSFVNAEAMRIPPLQI